jgi:hypothetical protein
MIAVLLSISTVPGHADRAGTQGMRTEATGTEGIGIEGMGTEGSIGPEGCVCSSVLGSWCRLGPPGDPILTRPS